MYRGDISEGLVRDLYKRSIYTTQGTNKNYIGLRPKVHGNILESIYSKAKNPNGNLNNILPIDKQANGKTESDTKIIPITLYQLHTE